MLPDLRPGRAGCCGRPRDAFGVDSGVLVETAQLLCAPALKSFPPGAPPEGDLTAPHLKCYSIFSTEDPDYIVDLETQFNTEVGIEAGQAQLLCVPATKTVIFPTPTPSPSPTPTATPTATPTPSPANVHQKCYQILDTPLGVLVDLETQFGTETDVLVDAAQLLCAPALKQFPPGAPPEGDLTAPHLKCYSILSTEDPAHIVDLETQFGIETNIEVGLAQLLCVPAAKEVIFPLPVVPPGPLLPSPHYKCYQINDPTEPPGFTVDLETQFGPQLGVDVVAAQLLCSPAIKYPPGGPPEGEGDLLEPHLKCHDIFPQEDPPHIVNLQTQFGPESSVQVGPGSPA